ncbi:hypothetical protein Tco_0796218 [Tanacetum coccineum]
MGDCQFELTLTMRKAVGGIQHNPSTPSQRQEEVWCTNITLGKRKQLLFLIPMIRFTKLIIFHLQRLHNFHPRPESPLHLPTEEPVLGHLKFSAKGSKQEVFGMTIPNELINNVIRGADYYDDYLEKVTKHQRDIAGEELSDPESPAPKSTKPIKQTKPKATEQQTVSKIKTKKSKHAPAKPKEKKRKPVSESSEDHPLAKTVLRRKRLIKTAKEVLSVVSIISLMMGFPAAKPRNTDTGNINHYQRCQGKGKEKVRRGTSCPISPQTFKLPKKEELDRTIYISEALSTSNLIRSLMKKCLPWVEVEIKLKARPIRPWYLDECQAGSYPGTYSRLRPGWNIPKPWYTNEGQAGSYPGNEIKPGWIKPWHTQKCKNNLKHMVDEQVMVPEELQSTKEHSLSLQQFSPKIF